MLISRKILLWLMALSLVLGCKQKKKPSLAGEDAVEVSDFIDFFPDLGLPYQYSDSSLSKKMQENDSLLISYKVFSQFVPDSLLKLRFNKNAKPRVYPLGKIVLPKAETYLFARTVQGSKKTVYLLVFDRKQQFANSMVLLQPDQDPSTVQSFSMDRRGTITKSVIKKHSDGSSSEGKDVYAYISEGNSFNLIMTDALDDKPTELINPIDTLPKKFKYAGDYTTGKMNLVSIRDGRKADRITFFLHFEKNKDCSGELKGEAMLRSATTAEYNMGGDPCKLKFTFSSTYITVKEIEGCGSYRPLNCTIDLRFPKKKEVKIRKKRK